MYFDYNYQSVPLLFFFVQGLIFSFLLFKKGTQSAKADANWLGLFVFLCCLYISPWMCGHAGWYARDVYREVLFFVPTQQFFFIGPVIFFYVRSLLEKDFKFQKKHWIHFAPGFIYLVYSLVVFVGDVWIFEAYFFYADGRDQDLDAWYQTSGLIWIISYTGFSIRIYNRYRVRIFQELSYADTVTFNWIRQFLIALLVILLLRLGFLVFYPNYGSFGEKFWYYLAFAILAYYISFAGFVHTIQSLALPFARLTPPVKEIASENTEVKSELSDAKLSYWMEAIEVLIKGNVWYENPSLTLQEVAKELNTTSRLVSGVINQGFQMNFNDYVNHYRIEAIKGKILKGEHLQFTLLSLAFSCGFNSKTTFNRVFKKMVGMTPLQYVKRNETPDQNKGK